MKYGTQLNALGKPDLPEALDYARELGCDGLEVSLGVAALRTGQAQLPDLLAQAETLRTAFDRAGLEFISLSTGIMPKHAQTPEVVTAACQCAEALGVRALRIFSSPHVRLGGPGSTLDEWHAEFDGATDARDIMRRDAENLAIFMELSQPYAVRWVFELHHGYTANSASGMLRLIDRFPADRMGILMDPGNMVFEGNEGWRNSIQLMGEYLDYIHCKNCQWLREDGTWVKAQASLSEGIADYPEIMTALKDLDFQGFLSIEDLRRGPTPEEKVGQGLAYLRALEASEERVMPA